MVKGEVHNFSRGSIPRNIMALAVPMTAAQLVNVLYSVVDRVYLGRLPGHLALTGLGLTIPIVSIIMGFANLCGTGGAPLCSIKRGQGDNEEAERVLGSKWLTGCELYVTLEPCAMCAGAMVLARLDRLWIGAMDPKNGACGSVFNVVQEERLNHRMEVETGILEAECGQILSDFFRNMRAVKARKRKLFRQRMTSPDNTDGGNN